MWVHYLLLWRHAVVLTQGCIGLSGVFDVNDHYHFEASRNIGGLLKGMLPMWFAYAT